jgi:hypothetical protein
MHRLLLQASFQPHMHHHQHLIQQSTQFGRCASVPPNRSYPTTTELPPHEFPKHPDLYSHLHPPPRPVDEGPPPHEQAQQQQHYEAPASPERSTPSGGGDGERAPSETVHYPPPPMHAMQFAEPSSSSSSPLPPPAASTPTPRPFLASMSTFSRAAMTDHDVAAALQHLARSYPNYRP